MRKLFVPFGLVLPLLLIACVGVASADIGEIRGQLRQFFGGVVRVTGTPTDGQVLTYSSSTGSWGAAAASGTWVGTATSNLDMAGYKITALDLVEPSNDFELNAAAGGAGAAGKNLYLYAGAGNAAANTGAHLNVIGGTGAGVGGEADLVGGAGTSGDAGGQARIAGGSGHAGAGGSASVTAAGGAADGAGGLSSVQGGNGTTSRAGGSVSLTGGTGHAGAGAAAAIVVNGGSAAGAAGTVAVTGATGIAGALTNQANVVAITAGVGAPTLLTAAQSGSLVTCTGTTVKAACTLPAAPAVGTFYDFLVDDADGLRAVANTGQAITLGALGTSASAGYVESVRIESGFRLAYTAANVWKGSRIDGTWRKDSTTAAGFAFTPTAWAAFSAISHTWDADVDISETGVWRQVGSDVQFQFRLDMAGAPPAADLTFNLAACAPAFTVDETAMVNLNTYMIAGRGSFYDAAGGTTVYNVALTTYYGTATDLIGVWSAGITTEVLAVNATSPRTWAINDRIVVSGQVPVSP